MYCMYSNSADNAVKSAFGHYLDQIDQYLDQYLDQYTVQYLDQYMLFYIRPIFVCTVCTVCTVPYVLCTTTVPFTAR